MFKVNNKDTRTTLLASFWYLYCKLRTYFTPCSSVSIVNFEHVISDWEPIKLVGLVFFLLFRMKSILSVNLETVNEV